MFHKNVRSVGNCLISLPLLPEVQIVDGFPTLAQQLIKVQPRGIRMKTMSLRRPLMGQKGDDWA